MDNTIHQQPPITGVFLIADPNSDVILRITVGKHGQEGSSYVELGGADLGDHVNSFDLDLGKAHTVNGKMLWVTSTVIDMAEKHNDLVLDLLLTAGEDRLHDRRERSVPEHGDGIEVMSFINILTR